MLKAKLAAVDSLPGSSAGILSIENPTPSPAQPTGMLQPVYIDVVPLEMVEDSSYSPIGPANIQYRYSNVALTILHELLRSRLARNGKAAAMYGLLLTRMRSRIQTHQNPVLIVTPTSGQVS
jgi:hypothetical protein